MATGAASAFTILGVVGVDSKLAEAALSRLLQAAESMAASANRMGEAAAAGFRKKDDGAKKVTESVGGLDKAFQLLAAGQFANQIKGVANSMLDAANQMQGFRRSLTAVTGSAGEAEKVLKQVAAYADKTPFDTDKLTAVATKFASMKQPISDNLELSAKLAYIFKKDLATAGDTVAEANAGVEMSLRRLKDEFGFTASEARKYGAVISKGAIVVGEKGSLTNDRMMKALRAFVADREKGLGGDLFGGTQGIGAAMSNLRSGAFQAFASLGEKIAPDVVKFTNFLRGLLDALTALPPSIQRNIAMFAGFFAVVTPLVAALAPLVVVINTLKGLQLFSVAATTAAQGAAGLGGAVTTTVPRMALLGGALGPITLALGAASLAISLYTGYLEKMDAATLKAGKDLVDFHNATKSSVSALGAKGVQLPDASVGQIMGMKIAPDVLKAQADALRKQANSDFLIQEIEAARAATFKRVMVGRSFQMMRDDSPEGKKAQAYLAQREGQKSRLEGAADRINVAGFYQAMNGLKTLITNIAAGKGPAAPAREYHEIASEAERGAQLRSVGMKSRKEQQSDLESEVAEARRGGIEARKYKIKSEGVAEGSERYKDIMAGKEDNEEQVKSFIDLQRKLIAVKKEGLEITIQQGQYESKLLEIQHKSTPESRIAEIDEEVQATKKAMEEKTLSEEEGAQKINELTLHRKEELQKQIDAQRDADIDIKKLYGDDTAAAIAEVDKKVIAMRVAGVKEVQIQKITASEKAKIYAEDATAAIESEQKIADGRAAIRNRAAATKENRLEERRGQGENVSGELHKTQEEQLKGNVKDITAGAARRKKEITAQLKRKDLDPYKRKELEDELKNLPEDTKSKIDEATQNSQSRTRSEEREDQKRGAEAHVTGEEVDKEKLGMKQQVLMQKLSQPGADVDAIGKKLLDNLRDQLNIGKQILADKLAIDEVGKTDAEKANLRNKYALDLVKLNNDILTSAQAVTAEMDKQNKASGGDDNTTLRMSGSYEESVAKDKEEQAKMDAKWAARTGGGKGPDGLATMLGIDVNANRSTVFNDTGVAKNVTKSREILGEGSPLADKRNQSIMDKAGAADAAGRAKLVKVEGNAKLEVTIKTPDGKEQKGEVTMPLGRAASADPNTKTGGR